jgi:predicted Rdx family selenoprotein
VKARLKERSEADVELVRSSGGVFEVYVGDRLKFSKKALGRFPTDAEIDALANG